MAQASGSPALRVKREALLLTAACVWLVNGLHACPEDGPVARNLMDAILPVPDSEDHRDHVNLAYPAAARSHKVGEQGDSDQDEWEVMPTVPYNPYGVVFLRCVVLHGPNHVPRMRAGGPFLSPPAFKYFFGASEGEISHKYYKVGIIPREVLAQRRVHQEKPQT
jgi:hypothetical protein